MLKIQGGEADIAEGVPFTQIEQIEGSEGITVEVTTIGVGGRVPQPHEAAFDDINVRKALNYATDKEALNAAVYGGVAEVANDMIPKEVHRPARPDPGVPYDLEQAKQLMAESSVPDGFSATFLYPGSGDPPGHRDDPAGAVGRDRRRRHARGGRRGRAFDRHRRATEIAIPLPHFTADVTVNDEVATLFWDNNPENVIRAFATGWEVQRWWTSHRRRRATDEAQRTEMWRRCSRWRWTMRRG